MDDDTVLTAHHCVTVVDNNNQCNEIPVANFALCTHGNEQAATRCVPATDIITASACADKTNDYAVIKASGLSSGYHMPMSYSTQQEQLQFPVRNIGYPGFTGSCLANNTSPVVTTVPSTNTSLVLTGRQAKRQNGVLAGFGTNLINTKLDAGGGQSGSALFYTPNGDAYVTGLLTTLYWRGAARRTGGPKVSVFRSFALQNF